MAERKRKESRKDSKGRVLYKGELQRKDGRYVYQYRDLNGNRKCVYSLNLLELRQKEDAILRDKYEGIDTYKAQTISLNALFDRYISLKTELRETTRSTYITLYNVHIRAGFGQRKLAKIRYSDVKELYALLLKQNMTVATLGALHNVLHPVFNMAVRDGVIRNNPTQGLMAEIKKSKEWEKGKRHSLTEEQQIAFMNYMNTSEQYHHWYNLFTVLLGTGCRVGEFIGLCWDDVDFEENVISINHTFVYFQNEEKKCGWSVHRPKTQSGIRHIPMLDVVRNTLLEEYHYQLENGFNKKELLGYKDFIFVNRYGTINSPQVLNTAIKQIIASYNEEERKKAIEEHRVAKLLPYFTCHHLRHTFCARFCEKDVNMKLVQEIMGHSDISITMDIYAEFSKKRQKEAFRLLDVDGIIKVD